MSKIMHNDIEYAGVPVPMTLAEAEAGTVEDEKTISPKVLHDYVDDSINSKITDNDLGTRINISTYTSTKYTIPSDGYVTCEANASGSSYARARIFNPDETRYFYLYAGSASTYPAIPVFVKKGMKVKVDEVGNNGFVTFIPIQ